MMIVDNFYNFRCVKFTLKIIFIGGIGLLYEEFNEKLNNFENNLTYLKKTGEVDRIREGLKEFISFIENNVFEASMSEDGRKEVKFSPKIMKKNPEASRYIDKNFFAIFLRFKKELDKTNPDVESTIKEGIDILQRLRGFARISSSSSF